MFQSWALYPNIKVYDIIAFPLRILKFNNEEINRKIKEIADVLGIANILNRYSIQLSGGQQQKVALASALVKNPRKCCF